MFTDFGDVSFVDNDPDFGCKLPVTLETGLSPGKELQQCGPLYYIRQPEIYTPTIIGLIIVISAFIITKKLRRKK